MEAGEDARDGGRCLSFLRGLLFWFSSCLSETPKTFNWSAVSKPPQIVVALSRSSAIRKTARLNKATQSVGTKWFSEPHRVHGV